MINYFGLCIYTFVQTPINSQSGEKNQYKKKDFSKNRKDFFLKKKTKSGSEKNKLTFSKPFLIKESLEQFINFFQLYFQKK